MSYGEDPDLHGQLHGQFMDSSWRNVLKLCLKDDRLENPPFSKKEIHRLHCHSLVFGGVLRF